MNQPEGKNVSLPKEVEEVIQRSGIDKSEAQRFFRGLGSVVRLAAQHHPHYFIHLLYKRKGILPSASVAREMLSCPPCGAYFMSDQGFEFRKKLQEVVRQEEVIQRILKGWEQGETDFPTERYADELRRFSQYGRVIYDQGSGHVAYAQAASAREVTKAEFELLVQRPDGSEERLLVQWDPFSLKVRVQKKS